MMSEYNHQQDPAVFAYPNPPPVIAYPPPSLQDQMVAQPPIGYPTNPKNDSDCPQNQCQYTSGETKSRGDDFCMGCCAALCCCCVLDCCF